MNVTTVQGRWASLGILAALLLAFSPIYLGGAFAAYKAASVHGRDAVLLVFGLCQFAILWVSLLSGAMGRTFELDKLKRYPLSPLAVFFTNMITSVIEPVALMTLPSLAAVSIGVAVHDGLTAGLQTALAAVLLLLVTLALIQLLLALLDDLLRREWLRYVAAFLFIATLVGFQLTVSRVSQELMRRARALGLTAESLAEQARLLLGSLPTVAAPASVAGTHPQGLFVSPWVGLATSVVFLILAIAVGARVMARAAVRPTLSNTGGGRARGEQGLSLRVPGLTQAQGLLFGRELVYLTRTPSILFQMLVTPLMVIALSLLHAKDETSMPDALPLFVLVSGLAGRNLMMWAYDGAGVRTLFLMPFTARDLVFTKLLGWCASTLLEATIVFAGLSYLRGAAFASQLPTYVPAYLAVLLVAGVIGTNISIRQPMKAPEKGMGRRSPGGLIGIGGFFAIVLTALAIGLMVFAARILVPDAHDALASCIVATMALAATAAIAWISLERSADLLEQKREKLIDVMARSADV